MSAAGKNAPQSPPALPGVPAGDPSMEDILASIRRILNEDEAPPPAAAVQPPTEPSPRPAPAKGDDVLLLDPSMMVSDPPSGPPAETQPSAQGLVEPASYPPATTLVGPEAARAAAASVSDLVRKLASERATQTHSGGPTIEDLVRAELRPILKEWLEMHLPALVERLVRAEIERVMSRAAP